MKIQIPIIGSRLTIFNDWEPISLWGEIISFPFGTSFEIIAMKVEPKRTFIHLKVVYLFSKEKNDFLLLNYEFIINVAELKKVAGNWFDPN